MEEVWKDIAGYEGKYQVSNLGNVRSLNWRNTGVVRNLYLKKTNKGYLHVELFDGKSKRSITVHRLVASAFLENSNGYTNINHKDENPLNNCVDNLEWCTASYNVLYSLRLHPDRSSKRKGVPRNRPVGIPYKVSRNKKICQLTKSGEVVKVWDNLISIKHETGWNEWHIEECCKGNRKTAKGYKWQYVI